MTRKPQNSFTGGELSPALWARADIQKYQSGLRTGKNGFVHAHGGFSNRPGTQFVLRTKYKDKVSRILSFAFSTEQTYALEFGDQYMRVYRDGGVVLNTAEVILGATIASPCVLTITGHPYSNDDWIYVSDVVGMTELNGKFYKVKNVTANTVELNDIDDNNTDSSLFTAYASGGNAASVYELATPYLEADLEMLKYTQSADVMTIVSREYQPRELTRTGHTSWTLTGITFAPITVAPASATASGGSAGSYDITYRVTAVDEDTGEESLSVESNTLTSKKRPNDGATGGLIDITWGSVSGTSQYNIYRSDSGSVFGFVGIADASGTSFKDHITKPDFDDPAPGTTATNPFSGADDYPGTSTYHLQRLAFGSSNNDPQREWLTQVGNYKNMNKSVPTKDSDAIVFTIAAQQVNEIRHMVSLRDLIVLTSGGEWVAKGSEDGVLTPSNIQIRPQTFYGAAEVAPVVIGNTIIFVQEKGSIVRDLAYAFESDGYSGNELSLLSDHLFRNYSIKEWCYAQAPYSLVWAVRDDGRALTMTYQREHQVWAWTWHETDGEYESMASVSEGTRDVVYQIVKRYINGQWVRMVERHADREFTDVRDSYFVDCGLSYEGAPQDVIGETSETTGREDVTITVTGHNKADGDLIDISDIITDQSLIDDDLKKEINGKRYQVASSTANTFKLRDEYAPINELTAPDDLLDAAWASSSIVVTGGQADPFGGTNAFKVEVTGTSFTLLAQAITDAKAFCLWAKSDVSNTWGLVIGGSSSNTGYSSDVIGDGEWHKITHTYTASDTSAAVGFFDEAETPVIGDVYYLYWPHANFDGNLPENVQSRDGYVDGSGFGNWVKDGYIRTPKETLSGLDHLEGELVSVLSDGSPQRELTVTNGSITLPRAGSRVHVGLPYETDLETLDLDIAELNSFGRKKTVSRLNVITEKTRGMMAGPNKDKLFDFKQRSDEEYNEPTRMTTGHMKTVLSPSWFDMGRICLRQTDPLPMTVLGVIPEVEVGG